MNGGSFGQGVLRERERERERERDIASGGIDGGDERPWELLSQGEEMLESKREEV